MQRAFKLVFFRAWRKQMRAPRGTHHTDFASTRTSPEESQHCSSVCHGVNLLATVKGLADSVNSANIPLLNNKNETVCYKRLGCFSLAFPWTSPLRPFPVPQTPEDIETKLKLFTREGIKEGFNVTLWPEISIQGSTYKADRPRTVFLTHGFLNNGGTKWLSDLKDAYLNVEDANVFIVDWGKGAEQLNYLQVASNTRIVGQELARFGEYIIKTGLNPQKLHLIGHSLGSHIFSYMCKSLNETGKPGRFTALDPAQPGFEGTDKKVRLNKDDASFVEVVHTNAKPFIPLLGFGMIFPVGHNDYYVNGGAQQPGCLTDIKIENITSIADLATIPMTILSRWISCSHGRSYEVFTASMEKNINCSFWARKMPPIENLLKMGTVGHLSLLDPIIDSLEKCDKTTCTQLGLNAPLIPARGDFALETTSRYPFCEKNDMLDRKLMDIFTSGFAKFTGIAKKIPGISMFI